MRNAIRVQKCELRDLAKKVGQPAIRMISQHPSGDQHS
jgi:hypothetical protein